MKLALISDTHDNTVAVSKIIAYLNQEKIEVALHAGDIINPGNINLFDKNYQGELHFVFGNNDGEQGRVIKNIASSTKTFCYFEMMDKEFGGKRVFMNHYSSISELVAQSFLFDLAVGGHDHNYRAINYGKTLFINPGTTSLTDYYNGVRDESDKSFVVIDLTSMEHQRVLLSSL